jgi:hypothetical protein
MQRYALFFLSLDDASPVPTPHSCLHIAHNCIDVTLL